MIRDPSDGSVREVPKPETGIPATKPKLEAGIPTSGLRAGSQKPEQQGRLERSREWLADYLSGKGAAE